MIFKQKVETMTISEFLNKEYKNRKQSKYYVKTNEFIEFYNKHHVLIFRICLLTGALFFGAGWEFAFADEGLDERMSALYFDKFIGIIKWVIVGKGGWESVSRMLKEDFNGAKRSLIQYVILFALLLGLPYGLNEIENTLTYNK